MANPGPATIVTVNTQSPRSTGATIQTIAVSMTPVAVATITVAEQSFGANGVTQATAATGILVGDVIMAVNPPSTTAGVGISQFRVDTAVNDKFYVSFVNPTAGSLTPPTGTWLITVLRMNLSNTGEAATVSYGSFPTSVTLN